jgi:hypothetical protein
MKELGFKKINAQNWLQPDQVLNSEHRILPDGTSRPLFPTEWLEIIQKPKLNNKVPDEIHKLFEVARGTMSYGYFFYPIFTFAAEQFTRIAEAAMNIKCEQLKISKSRDTFNNKVDLLFKKSILSESLYHKWKSNVKIRNMSSHPTRQNIINPAMAIKLMSAIADIINKLFTNN